MELSIHNATVRDLTFVNTAAGGNPVLASGGAGKLTIIIYLCQEISKNGNVLKLIKILFCGDTA